MAVASENVVLQGIEYLGTPLAGSITAAAATMAATIVAAAGKTAFVGGFVISGTGATAGSAIAVSLSDGTNSLLFNVPIIAGISTPITVFTFNPNRPLASTSTGATWTLTVASFGSGSTSQSATMWGWSL